jgi:hypothetical protein
MAKCTNAHEMDDGHKFCGECGGKPSAALTKCTACAAELPLLKSGGAPKFCPACGTDCAVTDGDLDAALDGVNAFLKARADVLKDISTPASVDDDAIDVGPIQELLKSATLKDDAGVEQGIDAAPIVGELLKGQSRADLQTRAFAEHQGKLALHLAAGQDLLLKAMNALGGFVKGLRDDLDALGGATRGRKARIASVTLAGKGAGDPTGDAGKLIDGPAASALLVKAQVAADKQPGVLTAGEIAAIETYAGMGWTLKAIAEADPMLAQRIDRAISAN